MSRPLTAVARHAVDQVAEEIDVEQPQFVHDDDLSRPHDTSAALACADDLKTTSCISCSGEGWPLRLVGFADHLVLAQSSPGEDTGRECTFQFIVWFEDQYRPASGHMAQASSYQRCRFS